MFKIIDFILSLAMILLSVAVSNFSCGVHSAWADEAGAEFNIKNEGVKKDNIFNLFFGGAPLMPTENGTVIIDAYLDLNDNQLWDTGEKPLDKVVICVLDDIEYPVPAFIPGLENGTNYSLKCKSSEYEPSMKQKNIFIKKKGRNYQDRSTLPSTCFPHRNAYSLMEPDPGASILMPTYLLWPDLSEFNLYMPVILILSKHTYGFQVSLNIEYFPCA